MSTDWNLIGLEDLGVLRFRGADAVRFLQGQVTNDVERLTAERSQLAGYHNPQGRTIALLRLVRVDADDVLAVLPRELIADVAVRLSKFVLRAKVKIADDSAGWRVEGLVAPHSGRVGMEGVERAGRVEGPGADRERALGNAQGSGADRGRALGDAQGSGADRERAPGDAQGSGADRERAPGDAQGSGADRGRALGDAQGSGIGSPSGATGSGVGAVENTDLSAAFEERATSWAAAQFEQARAVAETAGELSLAAAQLEESEAVVPLPSASALMLPDAVHSQSLSGGTVIVRVGAVPARWLVLSPAGEAALLAGCLPAARDTWRLLDIADGEAQVYAATSEEFVAQMLNLDALDAIAFNKGCYTGQEVIARAHYRGRVKRRLQRFVSRGAVRLAVGESGVLGDGRSFKVVEAAQLPDGRCEFLAVAPIVAAVAGATTVGGADATADVTTASSVDSAAGTSTVAGADVGADTTHSASVIDAEVLQMAYPLPQ